MLFTNMFQAETAIVLGETWHQLLQVSLEQSPVLFTIWVGVVGACIGSFLNVVVYRLPAGMSLMHPGSHCPQCQQAIRARDNLPVLGWILLRGRCRDCQASISVRYPLVEAAVAGIFLGLWCVDVLVRPWGVIDLAGALATFLLHTVLICTLLVMALIEWDQKPQPLRVPLLAVAIWLAFLARPTVILQMHRLAWASRWLHADSRFLLPGAALEDGWGLLLLNLSVGAAAAVMATYVVGRIGRARTPWAISGALLCSLYLGGLAATILVICATVCVGWLGKAGSRRCWMLSLTISVYAYILLHSVLSVR